MDDRAIVQALRDRNRDGLAAAYDRYAQRLYDYCVGLLQDSHTAADAVHDTLLVAADRAQQLRDPDRFRSWLYAIARNECLRQLRQRNRLAPLEKAGDVKDDTVDLVRTVQAEQARALVRDAVAALNPREQEVLNLTLRHELTGAELAAALGVSANHAHALTSKAREQLERSVGALLTARAGRGECGELDTMLTGWDGAFTPLLRKRVSRHLEKCAICGARRAHEVSAEALFAAIPFALLPIALRRKVLDSSADLQRVSHHGRIAAPYQRDGFPVPLDQAGKRSKAAAWLAGAAVMALLVGGGVALNLRPGSQQTLAEPPTRVTPTTEEPAFTDSPAPLSLSPSASPSPSRSVSPTPSPSPSRRVTPPTPDPPPCSTEDAAAEALAVALDVPVSVALAVPQAAPAEAGRHQPAFRGWLQRGHSLRDGHRAADQQRDHPVLANTGAEARAVGAALPGRAGLLRPGRSAARSSQRPGDLRDHRPRHQRRDGHRARHHDHLLHRVSPLARP